MPSLVLVCAHAKVFMMVWHPFLLGIGDLFIGATGSDDGDCGGTCSFSTFLFLTFGIRVQVTSGNLDRLRIL